MKRRDFMKLGIAAAIAPLIPYKPTIEPVEVSATISTSATSNPLTSREFTDKLDVQLRKALNETYDRTSLEAHPWVSLNQGETS